jgi:hypothetical protein
MKWKCSYCGKTTHTRRTCSRLKSDKEWLTRANIKFRKAAVELMMTHGYGPGTLLEHVVTVYGEHDLISRCPVMITGVDWDQINFILEYRHTTGKASKRMPSPLPFHVTYLKETTSWNVAKGLGLITDKVLTPSDCYRVGGEGKVPFRNMSIASPIPSDRIELCVPDGFYSPEAQQDFVNSYMNVNPDSFQERLKRMRTQIKWTCFKWMDYEEVEKVRHTLDR